MSSAAPPLPLPVPSARRRLLAGGALMMAALSAAGQRATPLRLGINAGVSFNESEEQLRRRYAELLEVLGRALGQRLEFAAVYSDRVAQAVQARQHDFLLIHTHAALRAEHEAGYRLLASSEDRKDNRVLFFVRPDSPMRALTDLAGRDLGVPGLQSWATATALATLRDLLPAAPPQLHPTRLQEVVPYMVDLRKVAAGACRSKSVVDDAVAKGMVRVIHATEAMPLYALVAAPGVPEALSERMRTLLTGLGEHPAYQPTSVRALSFSADLAARMRRFYLG